MKREIDAHEQFSAHFGFLTEPFTNSIAAKSLFISSQLKALFHRLRQLVARRGTALITGEVGSGKSTAIRAFAESLEKTQFDWVYIDDPTLGMRGLWSGVLLPSSASTASSSSGSSCPRSKTPSRRIFMTIIRRRSSLSMMRNC